MSTRVVEIVNQLLKKQDSLTNRNVAALAGISRQAVHKQLRKLVEQEVLAIEGRGRNVHYRKATPAIVRSYQTEGLAEDRVWDQLCRKYAPLQQLPTHAEAIVQFAFTKILNNAIDHSQSEQVEVKLSVVSESKLEGSICDYGIGAFASLQQWYNFESPLVALQELSKGKLTTAPDRHSGEGIFFVSKAVDFFSLQANGVIWKVDNLLPDTAVEQREAAPGTRVCFEIALSSSRKLVDIFHDYTEEYAFTKTRTVVKLFTLGVRLVSRSEARRLLHGLERFCEVILDFHGVDGVGQGFVDEVFRVWAKAHPDIILRAANMNETVAFMVRRGTPPANAC